MSDFGRVRREVGRTKGIRGGGQCRAGRIMNVSFYARGRYAMYALTVRGATKRFTAGRLVLEAFVGPPRAAGDEANHKSGDTKDNKLSNLEWVTPSENQQHAIHVLGHIGSRIDLSVRDVSRMRSLYHAKVVAALNGIHQELAEMFGVAPFTICRIVENKGRTYEHLRAS